MPTYEYECTGCDHRFEQFQRITEDPVRTCPACSKRKVKRLISAGGGLIFKGSGFYVTDSKGGGKAAAEKAAPAKTESSPASASKPTPKTESGGAS